MLRLSILLFTVLQSVTNAQERDPWLGKRVFIKDGAVAKVGYDTIDWSKISFPATVRDVSGDWLWLGRAWVQKKDVMETQEALEFYSEKIRLNPSSSWSWNARAAVWNEKGEIENAIKDYTEAIRLDPKDATPYFNRGLTFLVVGDFDAAIKDFTEAIRLDPKDATAFNNLAWLYATCPVDKYRDGNKAVEFATKACEFSAWRDWTHVGTLAAAYAESGDWENAIKYQEKAIELAIDEKDKAGGLERLELYKNKQPYREEVKKK
jgi:tetratricopeptide (TPR) repeat protein